MAIDLFCYVAMESGGVESSLDSLKSKRADLFSSRFLIAKVLEARGPFAEIADEHGLQAKSYFLVSLNEKDAADRIKEVAEVIKGCFPGGVSLVLLNNEQPI
jgi:hypothetical protein